MLNLTLPLNKGCYDIIDSGRMKEDYREIKPYWIQRICDPVPQPDGSVRYRIKDIDTITFMTRFSKERMQFECAGIEVGRTAWGPTPCDVFVIRLGDRIF